MNSYVVSVIGIKQEANGDTQIATYTFVVNAESHEYAKVVCRHRFNQIFPNLNILDEQLQSICLPVFINNLTPLSKQGNGK